MNIDNLTIKEARELAALFSGGTNQVPAKHTLTNGLIGKKVIIRTYSAGVHFGTLVEKSGNEVILKNSRRMWQWWAAQSISLSGVAQYGIIQSKSKIAPEVGTIWLEAIEIIPCADECTASIEGAKNAKAE